MPRSLASRRPSVPALLALCRVSNLPTVWTSVVGAVVLSGASAPWTSGLLLLVAGSALYCAGMGLNDLLDLEEDRRSKPERPIPSGRVSEAEAWALTLGLFGLGLGALLLAPHRSGFVGGLLLAGTIVAYDRLHRAFAWSVYLMAGCRFLLWAVTALAASGALGWKPALGGLAQFGYVLALTRAARAEKKGAASPLVPIPLWIAGVSAVDGLVLALFAGAGWLGLGAAGVLATLAAQRYVRGD